MEKFLLIPNKSLTSIVLIASLLFGCGRTAEEDKKDAGVDEFTMSGSIVEKAVGEYEGSGAIRFLRTLPNAQSSQAIEIRANLLSAGSKIELVMFASNVNLTDGVHMTLTPGANNTLAGALDVNALGVRTVNTARLTSFTANPLNMIVDFHGYGNSARVVVYPYEAASVSDLMLDSSRPGDLSAPLLNSALTGVFYGILMTDAHISTAHLRPALAER